MKNRMDTKYASDGCEKWSDLESANIHDPLLAAKLRSINRIYRQAPKLEKQIDFFSPTVSDITGKDDISLMDVAVFGLGKRPRFEPIEHHLKDADITIQGGAKCGMATIFDYDIFLFVVSFLVREMELCKAKAAAGIDAQLPARKIRPPISELLKFCRRHNGGKDYKQIESALERLKSTTISIARHGESHRRAGFFSLIGDVKIISETNTGKISEIEIDIPDWVYDGVVRVGNPSVLTLNPDYFLLNTGYHRFLHRMARKRAGKTNWTMPIDELYRLSGTARPMRSFKTDIKRAIKNLSEKPLPDYEVTYITNRKGDTVIFKYKENSCE